MLRDFGFEIGVDVARIMVQSLLADNSPEVADAVDQAINSARSVREDARP